MNIQSNISTRISSNVAAKPSPSNKPAEQASHQNPPADSFQSSDSSGFGNTMKRLGDLALATTAGAGAGIAAGALPILSIVGIGIAPFTMIAGGVAGAGTALGMEIFNPGQISDHAREALLN